METKSKTRKTAAKKTTATRVKRTKKVKPTYEQIQARAFEIYKEKGNQGNEMENWLQAENELTK
jgi:hypothetical protein